MHNGWVIRHPQARWAPGALDPLGLGINGMKIDFWDRQKPISANGLSQLSELVRALPITNVQALKASRTMSRCWLAAEKLQLAAQAKHGESIAMLDAGNLLDDPELYVYWDALLVKHMSNVSMNDSWAPELRGDKQFLPFVNHIIDRVRMAVLDAPEHTVVITSSPLIELWAGDYDPQTQVDEMPGYCCGYRIVSDRLQKFTI